MFLRALHAKSVNRIRCLRPLMQRARKLDNLLPNTTGGCHCGDHPRGRRCAMHFHFHVLLSGRIREDAVGVECDPRGLADEVCAVIRELRVQESLAFPDDGCVLIASPQLGVVFLLPMVEKGGGTSPEAGKPLACA